MSYTHRQIADALDYAVLSPMATEIDVRRGCEVARRNKLKSICVAPVNVGIAFHLYGNVSSVVGFPHGNTSPFSKFQEACKAMQDGAKELDVVVNYGRFLGGERGIIIDEMSMVCEATREKGVLVKAILETFYYSDLEIIAACRECIDAGVDFVKTSTGFGHKGATPYVVKIMLEAIKGTGVQVEASGGIKTYDDAEMYLDLGCTRLGSSRYLELLP